VTILQAFWGLRYPVARSPANGFGIAEDGVIDDLGYKGASRLCRSWCAVPASAREARKHQTNHVPALMTPPFFERTVHNGGMNSRFLDQHGGIVSTSDPQPLNGGLRTARQRSRYQAIIRVTLDLLRKRGFERTNVQSISSKSGVALATIYRYFKSRDRLIYVATGYWLDQIAVQSIPCRSDRGIENNLTELIRTAAKELINEPRLLEALARANLSADPEVVKLVRNRRPPYWLVMLPKENLHDSLLQNDLDRMIDHVWFSGLTRWAFGQKDYDNVFADIERVAHLVLNAYQCPMTTDKTRQAISASQRRS
jgi:AcrR family transcriptional regulator